MFYFCTVVNLLVLKLDRHLEKTSGLNNGYGTSERVSEWPLDNVFQNPFLRWDIQEDMRLSLSSSCLPDLQLVKNSHKLWSVTGKKTLTIAASFSEVYKSLYNVLRQIYCLL